MSPSPHGREVVDAVRFDGGGTLTPWHEVDLYSGELQVVTPHPEMFLAACAAVRVVPQRAVYVGDRLFQGIHGPQQVGGRAIWIPHSTLPANEQVAVDATPDAVASTLLEVLDIVDRWRGDG